MEELTPAPRYSWVGIIECPASEATKNRVSRVGNLLTSMLLVSLAGSILALSSGFGIGFGLLSGVFLPLVGLMSLGTRSSFLLKVYSLLCASVSLSTVVSGIVLLSLTRGDPPGCACDASCSNDIGVGVGDSSWCRHLPLARTIFWISGILGTVMVVLQALSCFASWDLSEDQAFLEAITVAFTEPLRSPLTPIVRRTAGYTYATGTWGGNPSDSVSAMAAAKKHTTTTTASAPVPLPPLPVQQENQQETGEKS
jgi:hypothetical protein